MENSLEEVKLKYVNNDVVFNQAECFKNYRDITDNNYSLLILGDNKNISSWLSIDKKVSNNFLSPINRQKFTTTIGFIFENRKYFLKFNPENQYFNGDGSIVGIEIDTGEFSIYADTPFNNSYYNFTIEKVDDLTERYRIYTVYNNVRYFLTLQSAYEFGAKFCFVREADLPKIGEYSSSVFTKTRIKTKSFIFTSIILDWRFEQNQAFCPLSFDQDNKRFDVGQQALLSQLSIGGDDYVILNENAVPPEKMFMDRAWLSFRDKNTLEVDGDRSEFGKPAQCLFHIEYNKLLEDENGEPYFNVNFIPLKNHISSTNAAIRGEYMDSNSMGDKPNVNFRNYTTIVSGSDEELGLSDISLIYNVYDREYTINPGEEFKFTVKKNKNTGILENDDRRYTLYPSKGRLNINDTAFIKNGAFGSDTPYLADKVKKLQNIGTGNGEYLYTWLYRNEENINGVWLDRYYFPPDSRELNFSANNEANILTKSYSGIINFDNDNGDYIFDKVSDLCFESSDTYDTDYSYTRVSKKNAEDIIDKIKDSKIDAPEKIQTGENPIQIDITDGIKSGMLDLSFDMYLADDRTFGTNILSNSANTGLIIGNKYDISPYMYTFNNRYEPAIYVGGAETLASSIVRLANMQGDMIKEIDIYALYGDDSAIKAVYTEGLFKDIMILTDKRVYIAGFDLFIKKIFDIEPNLGKSIDGCIRKNYVYMLFDKENAVGDDESDKMLIRLNLKTGEIREMFNQFVLSYEFNVDGYEDKFVVPEDYIEPTQVTEMKDGKLYRYYKLKTGKKLYGLPEGFDEIRLLNENPPPALYKPFGLLYHFPKKVKIDNDSEEYEYDEKSIQSIYCNPDGYLSAFIYTDYCISSDRIMYGIRNLYGMNYYIDNVFLDDYKLATNLNGEFVKTLFCSYGEIIDIAVDDYGRLAVIKKDERSKGKYLIIFDKTKKEIMRYNLDAYSDVFALDVASVKVNNIIRSYFCFIGKVTLPEGEIETHMVVVDKSYSLTDKILDYDVDKFELLGDYNNILEKPDENNLSFSLNLVDKDMLVDTISYNVNLNTIVNGWYNFRIKIDVTKGIFAVYMNDKPLTPEHDIDKTLFNDSHKQIFNYPLIFGNVCYKNNTYLHDFLSLPENLFKTPNLRIKNITAYSKTLGYGENKALRLARYGIRPITITLPAGLTNKVEEITRYFKYIEPETATNYIDINIHGCKDYIEPKDRANIINNIKNSIGTGIDTVIGVNEIKFV